MRVLLIGAAGNLGVRLIPALLAHCHIVVAFVRSPSKLTSLLSSDLASLITIHEGDATSQADIATALRAHNCDALINTAGAITDPTTGQRNHGAIASAVSAAAIQVAHARGGKPLRAWFIGGLGSLEFPGTGGKQIQNFLPEAVTRHHRETEMVLRGISTEELRWTVLCVAFMEPRSEGVVGMLERPTGNALMMSTSDGVPPGWEDRWIDCLPPKSGEQGDVIAVVLGYTAILEDVADMLAGKLDASGDDVVGWFVGAKQVDSAKTS